MLAKEDPHDLADEAALKKLMHQRGFSRFSASAGAPLYLSPGVREFVLKLLSGKIPSFVRFEQDWRFRENVCRAFAEHPILDGNRLPCWALRCFLPAC